MVKEEPLIYYRNMLPTAPIGILGETSLMSQVFLVGLNLVGSIPLVIVGLVEVEPGLVES